MKPLDRAVYWLEYVLRHGGASHLKSSGSAMSFTSHFPVDVCLVLIVAIAAGAFLTAKTAKFVVVKVTHKITDAVKKIN